MLPLLALLFAGLAYYGARGSLANFVLSWEHAYDESRRRLADRDGELPLDRCRADRRRQAARARRRVEGARRRPGPRRRRLRRSAPSRRRCRSRSCGIGVIAGFGGGLAANSTLSVLVDAAVPRAARRAVRPRRRGHGGRLGRDAADLARASSTSRWRRRSVPRRRRRAGAGRRAAFLRVEAEPQAVRKAPVPRRARSCACATSGCSAVPFFVCGVIE